MQLKSAVTPPLRLTQARVRQGFSLHKDLIDAVEAGTHALKEGMTCFQLHRTAAGHRRALRNAQK